MYCIVLYCISADRGACVQVSGICRVTKKKPIYILYFMCVYIYIYIYIYIYFLAGKFIYLVHSVLYIPFARFIIWHIL